MSNRICIICQTELTGRQQNACSPACANKVYANRRRDSGKLKGPKPLKYSFVCVVCDRPGKATRVEATRHAYCARVNTITTNRKLSPNTALVHIPKEQPTAPTNVIKGSFWWSGPCKTCGQQFISKHGYAHCSNECAQTAQRANKRKHSRRRRQYIISRDQETCQLCYTKVDLNLDPVNDFAPEIDHIHPVHLGGDNSRANLRLTHRVCNRSRNTTNDYNEHQQWMSYTYAA